MESLHSEPHSLLPVAHNTLVATEAAAAGAVSLKATPRSHPNTQQAPRRSDSGASFLSQATSIGLCVEQYISFRLRSVSCIGLHDKTQVRLKLQNVSRSTKPAKNLGDHTHQAFDFQTTVHNMTFDTVKIDVFDIRKGFGQNVKIGRAYLSLRDLQKKVGNAYDNDGDDNTEPEQSVLSARFDATAFCQKHDDVFEVDLPLYKHGSYSKFSSVSHRHGQHDKDGNEDVIITRSSERGQDVSAIDHRHRLTRSQSFAQDAMNGVEVGMITVQATLHFKDQTQNPLFAHLGKGTGQPGAVGRSVSVGGPSLQQQTPLRRSRTQSHRSIDSSNSTDSSTLGDNHLATNDYFSDHALAFSSSSEQEAPTSPPTSPSAPMSLQWPSQAGDQQMSSRILVTPSSPPNLSRHFGSRPSTSPPLSPTLSHSTGAPTSWNAEIRPQLSGLSSLEESDLRYGDDFVDGDDADYDEGAHSAKGDQDQIKGENLTQADRDREEELMANIMSNGNQVKKDIYLNRSHEEHKQYTKGKKAKFNFFSEQTRSAFKDIQLMYSSFFGHGWNLSRSEFWRGFHIVEQYYARNPTPTTNRAFDSIEILEHARHFVRLAIASYGSLPWVYFGYSFKVAPLNFVRFNSDRKNVQDYFKLNKEDMIVWHFDKRTALVPSYYIVRDPKYNALCIIIRGTFSITDAMTDLVCEYYPYKGGLVHKGIMDNARFVLERSGKDIEAALRKFNLKTVYCIGHSLGAGSASLLCSLLQDHFADYVTEATTQSPAQKLEVKAYLFAPPPICTPNLAAEWERTQIAFINENDIVCRMSYGNALDLKELIKIGAIESLNPAYDGLDPKEKLDRIIKVLEEAQERLRTVDDVPRLVTAGTVTYIHKIYEDTPVIKSKSKGRDSKFGLPETWSHESADKALQGQALHGQATGRTRGMSTSSFATNHSTQSNLSRSLSAITAALSLKNNAAKRHETAPPAPTSQGTDNSLRAPKVTPYQPNQPPVRLESSISLALSDLNEGHLPPPVVPTLPAVEIPLESPSLTRSIGQPIQYKGASNARELATASILGKSFSGGDECAISPEDPLEDKNGNYAQEPHGRGKEAQQDQGQRQVGDSPCDQDEEEEHEDVDEEEDEDEDDEYDEDRHKVFTTKKPRKNGSKKKEIRIEFSDKAAFMAIPLRANWLWHHFPQQYDSRIERALAWATAHKKKEERKQQLRAQRQQQRRAHSALQD
ncbi:hypothetical protein KVV02_007392 [Mortierella alpina]|uniref:sn-1-specific diacylglycerol lipase n=1 Tax=Mortierella alpina TaxID=64518 RepID=A0A9P8A3H0_MORAP|nr:hypothetical protein KVV02_007392 [Mortierella alpina]